MTQSTIFLIILSIIVLFAWIIHVVYIIRKYPDKVRSIEDKGSKREPPCHKYALYCIKYDGKNYLDIKDFIESYTDAIDCIVNTFDDYIEVLPMKSDSDKGLSVVANARINIGEYVVVTTDKVLIKSEEELGKYFDLKRGNENERE